jgi:hypothetical protein
MPLAHLIKQATQTPAQRRAAAIANKPVRKRDAGGLWLPTELEIIEGTSYKARERRPECRLARIAHIQAWNQLGRVQGRDFGNRRCAVCCVWIYGRKHEEPCGYCGGKQINVSDGQ